MGLSAGEYERLKRGPAEPTDAASIVFGLADESSKLRLQLRPRTLADYSLLAPLIGRAPEALQTALSGIRQRVGVDLLAGLDAVALWGTELDSSNGFMGISATGRGLSVRQIVDAIAELGRKSQRERTESSSGSNIEMTLFGVVHQEETDRIIKMVADGAATVERVELRQGHQLALFRERSGRYCFLYLWPRGLRVERLGADTAKPMHSAAQRALGFIDTLERIHGAITDPPTAALRFESERGLVRLEAYVASDSKVAVEVPMEMLGQEAWLREILENWTLMKPMLSQWLARDPAVRDSKALQVLTSAVLESLQMSESAEGVRFDFTVDTSVLVDGIGAWPED